MDPAGDERDSQYHGCTVAHNGNNVYNIHMKPKGKEIDAMPLSQSSGGSQSGPNLRDRRIQIVLGMQRIQEERMVQIQKEQEEHMMIQCEMMRWVVKSSWCHVSLLNPVQDRSPNPELTGHAVYRIWSPLRSVEKVERTLKPLLPRGRRVA